jgi:hypothetical protein
LNVFQGAASLSAGAGYGFTASLNTSAAGTFSATYTLNFSDENLPGATPLGAMTLTLSGMVTDAGVENGDFNGDDIVDGADFLAWQRGFGGEASLAAGDANHDGVIDGADLEIWSNQYGQSASVSVVPEPIAWRLLVGAAALILPAMLSRSRSK